MADDNPFPWLSSHIESVFDISPFLRELAQRLNSNKDLKVGLKKNSEEDSEKITKCCSRLNSVADRWERVLKLSEKKTLELTNLCDRPGVLEVLKTLPHSKIEKLMPVYLIWKNPWMCVSQETFIGSMLKQTGWGAVESFEKKYPILDINQCDPESHILLFSSEPFPFQKYKEELQKLPFNSVIINGESMSWFGIRSLEFLESFYTTD